MENLLDELKERIAKNGPLGFDEFMAAALYHPEWGYYASGKVSIGDGAGDFATSPHLSPLFGRVLSRFASAADKALSSPDIFYLIEGGPGEGILAREILDSLRRSDEPLYRRIRYVPDEISPALALRQRETLKGHADRVIPKAPEGFPGLYLSNELVDAFPVKRFRLEGEAVYELCVGLVDNRLSIVEREAAEQPLPSGTTRPEEGESWEVEVNTGIAGWLSKIAGQMGRGYILTIDYGEPGETLFGPHRPQGTIRGFSGHRHAEELLENPGLIDITASVDFTALETEGEKLSLRSAPLMNQRNFLFAFGLLEEAALMEEEIAGEVDKLIFRRAMGELIFPGGSMGESFMALIQAKDAPLEALTPPPSRIF